MAQVPTKQDNWSGPMAESLLGVIAQAAANPDVDVDKMMALLNMHDRIVEREAKTQFNQAMKKLNENDLRVGKLGQVNDKTGNQMYKFAKWEDMDAVTRPLMRPLGLWFSFDTEDLPGGRIKVIGTLHHEGGHSQKASISLVQDAGQNRNANQAMGSMTSYGKRYTAEMLLNIVREDEDDDAVASGGGGQAAKQSQRQQSQAGETRREPDAERISAFMVDVDKRLRATKNGSQALKVFILALDTVPTLDDLAAMEGHPFREAVRSWTPMLQEQVADAIKAATARLAPPHQDKPDNWDAPANGNGQHDLAGEGTNGNHGQVLTGDIANEVATALKAEKPDDAPDEDDGWPGPR